MWWMVENMHVYLLACGVIYLLYIYIYIFHVYINIYIERERESENKIIHMAVSD